MKRLLIAFLFLPLFSLSQTEKNAVNTTIIYPDTNWLQISDVKKAGWNAQELDKLRKFITDSVNTTGMLVIYHGKNLFQYGNVEELSYLASARKSVLSMLYGPYVENGTINLDRTVEQLGLDDIGGLLPIERKATIRHLLTARSGVYHPASNPGDATDKAPARGTVTPGSFWLYNNWDFNIAGYILEKESGKNIYSLVDSILAKPLQMQDWQLFAQRKTGDTTRSKYKAYHMWFSTRDMARLGYLMLRNGKWKEKQIISPAWVKTTTSIVTSNEEGVKNNTAYYNFGYSYLWWIWDKPYKNNYYEGAYTASGAFGQFITVIPKLDLVIAHKTKADTGKQTSMDVYLQILDKLIGAKE